MNRTHDTQKGQSTIESLIVLPYLVLTSLCLFYTFLVAIDKIRSLDAVYHTARAYQSSRNQQKAINAGVWCLDRNTLINITQPYTQVGPNIADIQLQFTPRSFPFLPLHGKSVMRTVLSDPQFLNKSWPNAKDDSPKWNLGSSLADAGMLEGIIKVLPDSASDPAGDIEAAIEAGE